MWWCRTLSWIELSLKNTHPLEICLFPLETACEIKIQFGFLPTQIPWLMGWFGLFCPAWHPLVRGPTRGNSLLLRRPWEHSFFRSHPRLCLLLKSPLQVCFLGHSTSRPNCVPALSQCTGDNDRLEQSLPQLRDRQTSPWEGTGDLGPPSSTPGLQLPSFFPGSSPFFKCWCKCHLLNIGSTSCPCLSVAPLLYCYS